MSLKQYLIPIVLIVTLVLVIYANTLNNGFVYDDVLTITSNAFTRDFYNLAKLFTADYFQLSGEGSFRPAATFTYFIDYALYGLKPWGYHLTNIVIHALNGISLYLFLTLASMNYTNSISLNPRISIIISLIFITHPLLTEAVNAVSFREDLLVFFFFITTLNLYLFIKHKNTTIRIRLTLYAISCVSYSLALLSKEMAVTMPLIIYCYERFFCDSNKERAKPINWYNAGYAVITLFYLYIRFYYFYQPVEDDIAAWTITERLSTIPFVIVSYIKLILSPFSLSADYFISPMPSYGLLLTLIGVILFIIFIKQIHGSPITFGIMFFFITLIPVYNIVPIVNPIAERYLYLPTIGMLIAFVCSIYKMTISASARIKYISLTLFIIILIMHSISVIKRNQTWRDNYTLWSDTLHKMPDSFRGHNNLGYILYKQGKLKYAIEHFQIAIKVNPLYVKAHMNLGTAYYDSNFLADALLQFEEVLKLRPNHDNAFNNIGVIYTKQGKFKEAILQYQSALRIKPNDPRYHYNLGDVYYKLARFEDAVNEFRTVVILNPSSPMAHYRLGETLLKTGLTERGKTELEFAIRQRPDFTIAQKLLSSIKQK